MIFKVMLTALQFILLLDIATEIFFMKFIKHLMFCKKSEKKLVTFSARSLIFEKGLIFGPSFCYTDFPELYVLLICWECEGLPRP